MDMVNMSNRHQPQQDEKCQRKASHWSTMNEDETLTSQGRLQLAPKQHYTRAQRNSFPHILQQHYS